MLLDVVTYCTKCAPNVRLKSVSFLLSFSGRARRKTRNSTMGVLKDFDCSKVAKEQATLGEGDYNIIKPGMSYCGFCTKHDCRAFRKNVVVNRGKGNHLVNDDIISGLLKCPACATAFELSYVALYQCKATVTVHLQQEEKSEFVAEKSEIVKLGSKVGANVFEGGLLTIDVKTSTDCVVM